MIIFSARVETGSNREEITVNSTSVDVIHERCNNYKHTIGQKDKTVMNIFKVSIQFNIDINSSFFVLKDNSMSV